MRPFFAADRDHRENDLACRYNVIEYYIVKAVFWQKESLHFSSPAEWKLGLRLHPRRRGGRLQISLYC